MNPRTALDSLFNGRTANRYSPPGRVAPAWLKSLMPAVLLVIASGLADGAAGGEKLDMDGMAVIGNRELPKALFIVPWKDPESALAPERPVNTLIDEAVQPVDPQVFRRKLRYYDLIHKRD